MRQSIFTLIFLIPIVCIGQWKKTYEFESTYPTDLLLLNDTEVLAVGSSQHSVSNSNVQTSIYPYQSKK